METYHFNIIFQLLSSCLFTFPPFFFIFRDHPNDTTPYHYYGNTGNVTRTECEYYTKSETRLTSGHLFVTEKYIFGRWAQKYNMTFLHPSWKAKVYNQSKLDTPFMKLYREKKLITKNSRNKTQKSSRHSKSQDRVSITDTRSQSFGRMMMAEKPKHDLDDGIFMHVGATGTNSSFEQNIDLSGR